MKRLFLGIAFWGIFTAIFSTLFFILIDNYTPTRWISYGLIHVAWAILSLNFYAFPEVKGGVIFGYAKQKYAVILFTVELVLGVLFIFLNNENWIFPLLCQAIPLGINGALYFSLMNAEIHSKNSDEKDRKNLAFITNASVLLQSSMKLCQDWKLAKQIERLSDDVKSSQIKCVQEAAKYELKFLEIVNAIHQNIAAGKNEGIEQMLKEASVILEMRNNIIKTEEN